jgi:protein HOOK3
MRKLLSCLDTFYTQQLGIPFFELSEDIDLTAIAKHKDTDQLLRVVELVMGAAVQCSEREKYIGRILGLQEVHQRLLMEFMQNIISRCERKEETTVEAKEDKKETLKLRQEKRALSLQVEELQRELAEAGKRVTDLTLENEDLKNKLSDFSKQIQRDTSRNPTGSPSQLSLELEVQLHEKDKLIKELNASLSTSMKEHAAEVRRLKDEIDVSNDKLLQLSKAESTIEMYRKKLEDFNRIKAKNKELEDIKKELEDKLALIEEGASGQVSLAQAKNYYKIQFEKEQENSIKLKAQVEEKDRLLKEAIKSKQELEDRKKSLEFRLREISEELESFQQDGRLSDDSFSLKGIGAESDEKESLQEQYDKALRSKRAAEERAESLFIELETYKQKLEEYEKGIKPGLSDNFKQEREKHLEELSKLYKEKDELNTKLFNSREEVHRLQNLFAEKDAFLKASELDRERLDNKLKEAQESERIALNELEILKKGLSGAHNENEKIRHLEMERDLMKVKSEVACLQLSIREKNDELNALKLERNQTERELKELMETREKQMEDSHQDELRKLKSEIEKRDGEISYLIKSKEEISDSCFKELRMMTVVLHEVGSQLLSSSKGEKTWLSNKRAS